MNDLLQPTLQDQTELSFNPAPLSAYAQYFITFAGGIGSAWYFSAITTKRLKADARTIRQIHIAWFCSAIIALITTFALTAQIGIDPSTEGSSTILRSIGFGNRILALATNIYVNRLQKPWFDRHIMFMHLNKVYAIYEDPWTMGTNALFLGVLAFGTLLLIALQIGATFHGAS